jgi:6-phosphogluconolactonase
MFTVNPDTGVLTPTIPASVAAGRSPGSVTVDPSGRFAYVANQDDGTISMYNINSSTGVLTPMTPAIAGAGLSPFGVTVDPSGKFAYVPNAYSADNAISQYTIDSLTGVLTPNTPSFVTAGNQPTDVAVDPTSKFAYVVNRTDDTVTMYTIDPNSGNLTAKGTIATGSLPFRMVFDPAGKFAYVADENSGVSIYLLGTDGTLTSTGAPMPGGNALAVAVTGTKR